MKPRLVKAQDILSKANEVRESRESREVEEKPKIVKFTNWALEFRLEKEREMSIDPRIRFDRLFRGDIQ